MFARKTSQERELRERVKADPKLSASVWQCLERSRRRAGALSSNLRSLSLSGSRRGIQQQAILLRALAGARHGGAQQGQRQRLREYAESNLPKIESGLLATTPIYPDFEQVTLSFSLDKLREALGPDDAVVRQLLSTESPDSLAAKLVTQSKLGDPAVRKALWDGGTAAIQSSNDPMIVLARDIDGQARAVRKIYEDEVQAPVASAQERIAKARFAVLGTNTYPDATFTLRLSYGAVDGWVEKGQKVEPFTHLGRLYERATGKDPFRLPQRWLDARDRLDMNTPFCFVTTNDIVGGNSGSPLVDAQGRLVGLAFDGNIHSIAGSFGTTAR